MTELLILYAQRAEQLCSPWELLAKSTLILTAGFLIAGMHKRRHVLACSAVWNAALLGLLVLPVAIVLGPRLAVWSVPPKATAMTTSGALPAQGDAGTLESVDRTTRSDVVDTHGLQPAIADEMPTVIANSSGDAATGARTPSLRGLVILTMALGTLVAAIRLFFALVAVERLRRTSRPVAGSLWNDRLSHWSRRLGIRQAVSVNETPLVHIPIVAGAFRPTILLPASLTGRPDRQHVDAVLTHELAHVKRGDYAWQLLLRFVQGMYWYHPLAWLMERPVAAARERACDEFCVHALGSSQRYAATLLAIAGRLVRRPAMSLGLAMARTPQIAGRLDAIEESRGNPACGLSRFATLVCLGVGLLIACGLASAAVQESRATVEHDATTRSQGNQAALGAARFGNGLGVDLYGDPLPPEAVLRLGTVRFRLSSQNRRGIAYSPDERLLATTDGDAVVVWNALTGERIRRLRFQNPGEGGLSGMIEEVTFSPNGIQLAARSGDGMMRIWDVTTGEGTSFAADDAGAEGIGIGVQYRGLAFSPNGALLATNWNRKTIIFDATGRIVQKLQMEGASSQYGLVWSPDGTKIAQGLISQDGLARTARLWDVGTGEFVREFNLGLPAFPLSLAISPDGKTLAGSIIASGREQIMVCLWDLASGELKAKLPSEDVVSLHYTPDGKTLIGATESGKINAWNVETRELRYSVEAKMGIIRSAALAPDGKTLALGTVLSEISQWDVTTGQKKFTQFEGHPSELHAVAYSPEGRLIATGARDRVVRIWDAQTGKPLHKLNSSPYARLAFAPNGERLATAGLVGGAVYVWDVGTGELLHTLDKEDQKVVSQLGYTQDGQHLIAIGSRSQTAWSSRPVTNAIFVWDATTGEPLRSVAFNPAHTESMMLLPDERAARSVVLGTASNIKPIHVLDLQTGEQLAQPTGHSSAVNSLAYANGLVASGSRDKTIRLWDTKTWESVAVLEGHTDEIKAVAFSPDGRWLASADEGGSIRLWNVANRTQVHEFRGHDYSCASLCFSPDGTRLVTAMTDSTALVWDIRAAIAP